MSAVHVQRVLGERSRGHFEHHRRALARRVVILLHAVNDALARGVIDDALSAHRMRDGAALCGVLAFGFDGDRVAAEDVELAFGKCLLVELSAFGRRCDGVEDAGIGDARFRMVGNELVAVGGDANPRIPGSARHDASLRPWAPRAMRCRRLAVFELVSTAFYPVKALTKDLWTRSPAVLSIDTTNPR